jgi:hypothetical protein
MNYLAARKREFEGGPGGPPMGDFKKPRFEFQEGGGGGGGEETDEPSPPATLRVLIRNSDAGGIIGKVGERTGGVGGILINAHLYFHRVGITSRDSGSRCVNAY